MRLILPILAALVVLVLGGLGYWYFLHEEQRLTGPLTEALLEVREPGERRQELDAVFARFVPEDAPLAERVPTLAANGFECSLRPANVAGSTILTCIRPTEGSRNCEGFLYYGYETAAGEIIETMGTTFFVSEARRVLGRCDANLRDSE